MQGGARGLLQQGPQKTGGDIAGFSNSEVLGLDGRPTSALKY